MPPILARVPAATADGRHGRVGPAAQRTLRLQSLAVLLLSGLAGRYLFWRATATLNLSSPAAAAVSLVTLIAEALLIGSGFLQLWFSLLPAPNMNSTVERAAAGLSARLAAAEPVPRVDVLVPSRGEPPQLIERCLRGCLDLDYPAATVWLLDDSDRPLLRDLCRRLGCRYLARADRRHAKAGNLNFGLTHSDAELVAVFDADVVPLRSFLRRTVGCFTDPAVALVQTPQHDMSANPVMRNLHLERWLMPDEESFYRWVEPTRQALGAVVCAGTSFVMRRAALDQVGGFETGTPSEDLATGIRLAAAGWTSLYLAEKLSAGLAPASVGAMARQRCRWASGTVQVLRTGASPLTLKGLRPLQRLGFLEGIAHWLAVLPQALLTTLIPLAIGLLGVAPLRVDAAGVLLVALPFQLAQLLLVRWLSRQARSGLMNELYRWIFLAPISLAVLSTLLGRPQRFRVTAKSQGNTTTARLDLALALPLLALLALQLLAIGRALQAHGQASGGFTTPSLLVTLVWIALTALLLLLALRACWQRPGQGGPPWFRVEQPVRVEAADGRCWPARLQALSEEGAELLLTAGPAETTALDGLPSPPAAGETLRLTILTAGDRALPLLALPWTVAAVSGGRGRRAGAGVVARLGGLWGEAGLGGAELPAPISTRLQAFLYRRPGLWPSPRAPLDPLAVPRALWRLLRPPRPERWFDRSLVAQNPAGLEALQHLPAPPQI